MNTSKVVLTKQIPINLDKKRLDVALSALFPDYSRAHLQGWIKDGFITVDGKKLRAKDKIHENQTINIDAILVDAIKLEPQEIAINVIYEDEDIIIINKPAGLTVHPGAGNADNTLLNALLYRYPELAKIPRAGIIHRLDKDTTGLLVITRNLAAHTKLVAELQAKKINREYVAIVNGVMTAGATIDAPIGRHRTKRTNMAVVEGGKPAITHYRVIKRFPAHTYVRVILETGRTHQIRVHFAHIGFPIVGDPTYGGRVKIPPHCSDILKKELMETGRQMLHAKVLRLMHPRTNKLMEWEIDLPDDMKKLLDTLCKSLQ